MAQTQNDKVYSTFIDDLMSDGKVDDRVEGSFRASVELRPYGRFSPGCDIRFGYDHGIHTFRLSVHVDSFMKDGEKHQKGMFPSAFDTKEDTPWKPMRSYGTGGPCMSRGSISASSSRLSPRPPPCQCE